MREFIIGANYGLGAKAGSRLEVGSFARRSCGKALPPPAPLLPLSDPEQPLVAWPRAAFPWRQLLLPNNPSVLTCRTIQLQSNAFLLCAEAWDRVPPVSLTFHLWLWRVCSWIVSGYLRVEFHSSETFRSRPSEELAWNREHTKRPAAQRVFCHCCWQCLEKMVLSRIWESPREAMGSICVLSLKNRDTFPSQHSIGKTVLRLSQHLLTKSNQNQMSWEE